MAAKTKTKRYYSTCNVTTRVFRHVSIGARQRSLRCGQNLRGPLLRATLPMTVGSCARAMADTGRRKGSYLHHQSEFLHNYTFESMHDGDHDGVVRIFVGLSCKLGGLIIYLIINITRHNFSPTRSVIDLFTLRGTIFPLPGV